jgi:hypothetical protein
MKEDKEIDVWGDERGGKVLGNVAEDTLPTGEQEAEDTKWGALTPDCGRGDDWGRRCG